MRHKMRQRIFIKRTILGSYSKKTRRIARIIPRNVYFPRDEENPEIFVTFPKGPGNFLSRSKRSRSERPFARKRTSHRSLDVFKRELSKNVHEFLLRVSCWSQGRNLSSRISLVPLTNFGSVPMCQSALASARYA